ncbi:MAG TPA: cystathionine beta-lyase [Rhizomicrobium sp.]|nr:cystathionine beta-lyase [Rhizomicrobium sp.]
MSASSSSADTCVTHAGRMSREHYGVVNTPVYRASTVLHENLAALEATDVPYIYGRLGTPTSRSLEDAATALEGGARTVLCPSGLSAITTAILSVCTAGDHLLVTDSCYGPTRSFCDKTLKRLGIDTTYYEPTIGGGIAELLRANTRAVYCESPGSLTFELQDMPAIAEAAHARGASVLLDNTWATPLYFNAFAHGVDISIQAATKYVGGHADLMLGYVTANESHAARIADAHEELGLCASGDDCFLALRGLRTLCVRLARHQETALKLARWLRDQPQVARVLHPAFEDDPGHAIWKRDFKGASGLFGLMLKPVAAQALSGFFDGFSIFGLGYSWGGYESLIVPAHIRRTAKAFGAEGPVLRIHAGLEDADELLNDLARGFERMRALR